MSWGADMKELYSASCARCARFLLKPECEFCWYCCDNLCAPCWEEWGHCGHPEADAANERCRAFDKLSPEEKRAAARIPMPSGDPLR